MALQLPYFMWQFTLLQKRPIDLSSNPYADPVFKFYDQTLIPDLKNDQVRIFVAKMIAFKRLTFIILTLNAYIFWCLFLTDI